jgi:pyridoxamine 5'-phosphate oxidase
MSLFDLRTKFDYPPLTEANASADPFAQFNAWMDEALARSMPEPNAMTLVTTDDEGQPQARVVLLRGADPSGFVFFTNYASAKGQQISAHPRVSLLFFWPLLGRQIRISGKANRVADAESDAYFASRPRGHQIGAWASEQSAVIASREVLEARTAQIETKFAGGPVPRPAHWGGFRVQPHVLEFWQGQENRLHDRLRYRLDGSRWIRERLSP